MEHMLQQLHHAVWAGLSGRVVGCRTSCVGLCTRNVVRSSKSVAWVVDSTEVCFRKETLTGSWGSRWEGS